MNVISFRCGLNVARSLLLTYCRCQFIASSTVGSGVALNSVASHKAGSAGQGAGLWDIHACMVLKFTSENILKDPYMTYAGQMVLQELGLAAFWTSVIVLFLAYLVYRFLHRLGERQAQDELIGGRNLTDDVKVVAALMRKRNDASTLYFDDLPLKKDSEVQNIAMLGSPGTGKTNAINKLIKQARERGDMAIIYDKAGTYTEKHYNENTDKLLNAMDSRCENWDLWAECRSIPEFDSMSSTLIPMSAKEDPFWQGSARTIFTGVGYQMGKDPKRSYNKLLRTLLAINLKDLRAFLSGTEAASLMEEKVEKTAISIRSVLTNYVKALRYLQGIEKNGKKPFTIREWMKGVNDSGNNGILFITSHDEYHESVKPLVSVWLAIAAKNLMSMTPNPNRRVWFIYDELISLHKLAELPDVLAQARKFGGCFTLGFQNKSQLDYTYGVEYANAMFDLINTRFFFRSPSEHEATFAMKELGQRRAKIFSEQYSYGADTVRDGVSFSKSEEDVYLVNYSDIQSLPNLSCYITLPGDYPVVKMAMRYEKLKDYAPSLLPRDMDISLDAEIEEQLEQRELEDPGLTRLLAGVGLIPADNLSGASPAPSDNPVGAEPAPSVKGIATPIKPPSTSGNTAQAVTSATAAAVASAVASTAGREQEIPGFEYMDKNTGELVREGDDAYHDMHEAYEQSMYGLQADEKNILVHRNDDSPEVGDRW
ncbi:type IV conjugative transfer system coupling protein TraD (plasmid) [Yersinia wautersii]|uniref:type IV conjugative transfer system coupling protein TraD n=1 Tax=Yersinia pseudotuberculosis TaxID=633 RepID=UPI000E0EDDE1